MIGFFPPPLFRVEILQGVSGSDAIATIKDEKKDLEDNDQVDPTTLPPQGTEVYVGNLDAMAVKEGELRKLFEQVGKVHDIRIKTEEKNSGRKFAFVVYYDRETASKAVSALHTKLLNGKKLIVTPSEPKHKLFIGGLPKVRAPCTCFVYIYICIWRKQGGMCLACSARL